MFQLIFLNGCFISDSNDVLVAPECVNEEYEIFNLLKKSVYIKSKIVLETPKNTNNKNKNSAITFLNNKNSAVLFYNTKEKNNLHMAIFYKQNTKWKYSLDIPLSGTVLDTVLTTKDQREKTEFLIVGTEKNSDKVYNIYNCEVNNFRKIYSSNYSFLALYDVNLDGVEELISLSEIPSNFTKSKYNVKIDEQIKPKIMEYEKNNSLQNLSTPDEKQGLFLVSSMFKDGIQIINCKPGISEILSKQYEVSNYIFDKETFGALYLFITHKIGSVIPYYRANILNLSNKDFVKYDLSRAHHTNFYLSKFYDINKDSKLEFTLYRQLPGYTDFLTLWSKHKGKFKIPCLSQWFEIRNEVKSDERHYANKDEAKNTLSLISYPLDGEYEYTFMNYDHNYGIKFPKRWLNKVTAKYKNNTENIEFFVDENSLQKDSQKLLSIKVSYSSDKNTPQNNFFKLYEKNGISYFANLHNDLKILDPSLKLSEQELKKMFFIID